MKIRQTVGMDEHNPYSPPFTNPVPVATDDGQQILATRGTRLGAIMIDGIVVGAITMPLMWLTGYWDRMMTPNADTHAGFMQHFKPEQLMWAAVGLLIVIAINWRFLQNGQTIGKRACNIRVVRKDGSPISVQRIITHRMLPLQIISQIPVIGGFIGLIDACLIFRKGCNTLHDDIADTKVIIVPKTAAR